MNKKLFEIVAGPNGSGKTTVANALFQSRKKWRYINADLIARGLDLSNREGAEIEAGRVMLSQVSECLESGESFGLETTLSGRIWQKYAKQAKRHGYRVRMIFVTVASPKICHERIKARVSAGGHFVPDEVVARRYRRGVELFKSFYRPLLDEWFIFDNSDKQAQLIAYFDKDRLEIVNAKLVKEIFNGI